MKTSALYFNGSGSRVEIGNPATVQITGDQTIELWLRPQVLGKRQNPFAKAYGGEGTITLEPNGALSYYHGVAGGNADPYQGFHTADGMIAPGRWNHLAVVRDLQARKLRWYVDGVQVMEADAAWGAAVASPLPLLLGQGYVEFYTGELCEVRLWAGARTQAQIQQTMRRKLAGSEAGLAGYWPLDEGVGGVAHDRSPAGNHGTMISGEWRATGPDLQPAFESLRFDGSNDYVEIGNPPSVQLTGDQTIELWLRPRVLGKRQNPFAKAYGGEGTITLEPDGSIGYYCGPNGYDTEPYADFHTPANVVPAGRWTHVAVTRQIASKQLRWYCNGELVAEQTTWIPGVGAGGQPLRIGKGYTNDFEGDIAEVRLWSTVRSQAQLRADMNRRLSGREANLAGYWPLDDGPTGVARDLSPANAHGTVIESTWAGTGPGLERKLGLRVGGGDYLELPTRDSLILGSQYTQEAWICPEINDDGFHGFLGNQPDGGPRSPSLWVYQRRAIHFVYGDSPSSQQGGITPPVLSGEPGRWHHVAASFDGSLFRIYVDGELVHTQGTTAPPAPTPVRWIGRVDNLFVGSIADVRLWTVVRSQAQIRASMNRRLQGNEAGLAGYWPLDGGTEDRSRHGNHGTLLADAHLRLVQHPLPATPPWSPALWVAGSYVELPNHPSLILGSQYTQEAWIRPEINDDGFHGFLGNQPDGGPRSPSLWVFQRRAIHFVYGDSPSSQQGGITPPVLSGEPGRWHHVAASFDGSLFRIYVDGALVHTQGTNVPPAPTPVRWIGRVDNFFAGSIADVRLWNVVRSDAQIQANMNRRLWGNEPGLVGYWPLDDAAATARDRGPSALHGAMVGLTRRQLGIALTPSTQAPAGAPVVGGIPSGQSSFGAPAGGASTIEPVALPGALQQLSVDVMFVPFPLPLQFEGQITLQPLEQAVRLRGRASMAAPFDVVVDPLEVALANGDDPSWMVKFALPQSQSLEALIRDKVLSQVPGGVRPLIEALAMPYLALYHGATVILANEDGEDEALGNFLGGFNVFATVNAAAVPPFNLLHATFPQIGLDSREVVLGFGAGSGAEQQFFVGAALQLNVELGTSLVVLESIALDVSKDSADATVGAGIEFRLDLAGEILQLRGGIELSQGAGTSVSIWGALDAADGAWRDPLGLRGLTIVGLGVQVGATPTFPWIVLGVRGEVHLGDGLLGARVGILIDASDASKCILDVYSEEGLNLPRLLDALTGSWLGGFNLGGILDVALTDLQLYCAPKGGTIAGQSYDPGLAIAGRLHLWGFNANVAGKLDFDHGGSLRGNIDPIILNAGGLEFLRISAAGGDGGANIDVVCTTSEIGGKIDGRFRLLNGLYEQSLQAQLGSHGFTVQFTGGSWGIYQNASLTMESGLYRLAFGPTIGVSVNIAGYSIGLSVGTTITTEITSSSFSQGIRFAFSAMGMNYSPGPFAVSVPFSSVEELANAFYQFARDLIVNGLLGSLVQAATVAFDWVKQNVTAVAQDAAVFFENVGAAASNIATGLVNSFGVAAGDAVGMLSVGADEAASILRNSFGWTVDQTGVWLRDVGGYTDTAINAALGGAGYAVDEVGSFMADVFGGGWIPYVDLGGY